MHVLNSQYQVERHYGIYREKLHPLVLAFSAVAGHPDAAHCYTTPPLVAVSTAFRRIKDAILTELRQMAS